MTEVLAIIPARGGSKGIPRKNLALCAGRPLVDWTIQAANESRCITHAVLSSDDTEIRERAAGKVLPQSRPAELADDEASTEAVISYVLDSMPVAAVISGGALTEAQVAQVRADWEQNWFTNRAMVLERGMRLERVLPDIVVLLQPTSPLRDGRHIDEAIDLLERTGADSVVSVSPTHAYLWDAEGRPQYAERRRRQDMAPQYEENGAIYVFTMHHWRRTGNRLGGHVELYVMGEEHRVQVDTPFDLKVCELLLERVPA